MKVRETDQYFVVTFFPDAEEVEVDDRTDEDGWKAVIGEQDGSHIVMKVMYDKNRFPLNKEDRAARGFPSDAKTILDDYAANISDCAVCKRLDANVAKVTDIQLFNTRSKPATPTIMKPSTTSTMLKTGNPVQDIMAQLMFDTRLNQTGKVLAASALNDDALLAKSMPTTVEGMVNLVADLTDYASGKGNLFRSPSEVTEYVKALREGAKPSDEKADKKNNTTQVFRRASTIIVS